MGGAPPLGSPNWNLDSSEGELGEQGSSVCLKGEAGSGALARPRSVHVVLYVVNLSLVLQI